VENRFQNNIHTWVNGCSDILHEYLELTCSSLNASGELNADLKRVVNTLTISCHLTSESSLILVGELKLWDAEMLVRSILEGTTKLLYICTGNNAERMQKAFEYEQILPEIKELNRHKRAEVLLSNAKNISDMGYEPIREALLSPEELSNLSIKYPKKIRKEYERKWSFSEIIYNLSKSGLPGYRMLPSLAYGYGMGSHMTHQDADAIGMILDRNSRSPERRDFVELAHSGRLISDLIGLARGRAIAQANICSTSWKVYEKIDKMSQPMLDSVAIAQKEWWEFESSFDGY
jgi:hypothetical protein